MTHRRWQPDPQLLTSYYSHMRSRGCAVALDADGDDALIEDT